MQAIPYYLLYPLLYLLASLPFGAFYKVSDALFHLFWISGYRRKVVKDNLRNSFPEKSEAEIATLSKAYYRYLCDLTLETFKTLTMTEEEARTRCEFHEPEWMKRLYQEKRSIILILGHYGNWEWAGPGFSLESKYQLYVIYRPLSNPYFEKMMHGMRTKFGTRITPARATLRDMVATRGQMTAFAFIADQTAPREQHWIKFLNQDTVFFTGPEKLAVKFDYPVVYLRITRPKRGYYEIHPELLFENPRQTRENEITEAFAKKLEGDITKDPVTWLWSHRRWKHDKPPLAGQ